MVRQREYELVRVKLEASELRIKVNELESVISQLQKELKESNKLLRQQRLPPRPNINNTQKQLIAASQKWKCKGLGEKFPPCPLLKTNDGLFCSALYIIDHKVPWSKCGRNIGNLQAICAHCSSVKTRWEIANEQYRRTQEDTEDSDNDSDDE